MNYKTEPLPCPFCGGEAETHEVTFPYHYWDVWCDGECFDHFCEKPTEAEAIAAWNTRSTLTAEQVRECVQHVYYEGYNDGSVHRGHGIEETNWQAIADELNGKLGNGTCKITATATNNLMYPDYMTKWYELSCGHSMTLKGYETPKWCAVCGKAVSK